MKARGLGWSSTTKMGTVVHDEGENKDKGGSAPMMKTRITGCQRGQPSMTKSRMITITGTRTILNDEDEGNCQRQGQG